MEAVTTPQTKRKKRGQYIPHLVENVARSEMEHLGAQYRLARSGVPHILVKISGVFYSCCFFGKTRTWRVFWPSMVHQDSQSKVMFDCKEDMVTWLESEKARVESI